MSATDTTLLRPTRARPAKARSLALLRRIDLPIVGIVAVAFLWIEHYTSQVEHWGVMTDELQHVRLALSIVQDHTLIPHIHGQYVHVFSQLYPLLLAPIYAAFGTVTAFHVAHALNALLMASTAVPAYLLAREVTGHRLASYAVGALTVAVPWVVLSTLLLTEVVAYPVFVWSAWAMFRAVVAPSARRDVVAVVWLVLAFLARTQFILLWGVFAVVLLGHELSYRGPDGPAGGLRTRLARIAREHRVLVAVYALALLGLVAEHLRGGVNQVLGSYAGTATGDLFPSGMSEFMRTYAAWTAVAIGIVPVLLAVPWGLSTLFRPLDRRRHAFAVLLVVSLVTLVVEVSSFTIRFTHGPAFEDRYLFYVVPLLLVGALACLTERRARTIGVVLTGVALAYLVGLSKFQPLALPFFASPDVVFHQVLNGRAWQIGHHLGYSNLGPASALRAATVLLALGLAAALRFAPRRIVIPVLGAALLVWGVVETTYTFRKIVPQGPAGGLSLKHALSNRDGIDRALPAGAHASMVPAPAYQRDTGSDTWWDVEMWNKKVTRVIGVLGHGPLFTPFPSDSLAIQLSTGRLVGGEPTPYLVFDAFDTRFRPLPAKPPQLVHWGSSATEVIAPARPWRADWATLGFDNDGWGLAGNHTQAVRVYRSGAATGRVIGLTLSTEGLMPVRRYVVTAGGRRWTAPLTPAQRVNLQVPVCVRGPRAFADVNVSTTGEVRLPDKRQPVTLHLDRVTSTPDPGACAPGHRR
jgi:hypothetical protein